MIRVGWRAALACLGVAAGMMVGAASAGAAPMVSIDIQAIGGDYDQYFLEQEATANGDGTFTLADNGYGTNFSCDWSITVNPDPSITNTFTLTNLALTTQTFVMTVTLPIGLFGPTTVRGGYFGNPVSGTQYTDTSGNSDVTLWTVPGSPFYQALVNAVPSMGLGSFDPSAGPVPPFPGGLNANGGPGIFGNLSQQAWGTPIPSQAFGPASGNMQIRWVFSLTAGDQVSTKGFFQLETTPVPEPGSLVLIGLGLAAVVGLRARRA